MKAYDNTHIGNLSIIARNGALICDWYHQSQFNGGGVDWRANREAMSAFAKALERYELLKDRLTYPPENIEEDIRDHKSVYWAVQESTDAIAKEITYHRMNDVVNGKCSWDFPFSDFIKLQEDLFVWLKNSRPKHFYGSVLGFDLPDGLGRPVGGCVIVPAAVELSFCRELYIHQRDREDKILVRV